MDQKTRELLDNFFAEVQMAVQDSSRTFNDVSNIEMKDLLQKESATAISLVSSGGKAKKNSIEKIVGNNAAGLGVTAFASVVIGGLVGGAGSAAALAAAGATAGSAAALAVAGATAGSAAAFAAAGATAGSALPVVGTVIGGVVGVGVGFFIGLKKRKKDDKQAQVELEEIRKALEKQSRYIRQLEEELERIMKDYKEARSKKNEERCKYILSLVTTHHDLSSTLGTI